MSDELLGDRVGSDEPEAALLSFASWSGPFDGLCSFTRIVINSWATSGPKICSEDLSVPVLLGDEEACYLGDLSRAFNLTAHLTTAARRRYFTFLLSSMNLE